jgi:hypothetical protein
MFTRKNKLCKQNMYTQSETISASWNYRNTGNAAYLISTVC